MAEYFFQKRVLVTGAAGFIGSHLCDRLVKLGAQVTGVDSLITGRELNLKQLLNNHQFHFIQADVSTPTASYLPVSDKYDCVFHLASPASPPKYQAHPVETYLVNSLATHLLLEYLKTTNPDGRFLFASTSEVYGDPQQHPQAEHYWGNVNPNGLRSCYDESKRLGETICGVYNRQFDLDARIARIFNTYGPRLDPKDGRVISSFITQAFNKKQLTIYGDGSQTRSYCYVDDLVDGLMKLMSQAGLAGETVNLGNPEEMTVMETAQVIFELINHRPLTKADYRFAKLPEDDPVRRQPDISKAKQLLGWQPRVSLREGIKETIERFRTEQLQSTDKLK